MKALIRYKHGTPPYSVMTGTEEEIKTELSKRFDVMEIKGFYFDKKNIHSSPALRRLFRGPHPKHDYYVIIDADKWQNKLDKTKLPEFEVEADGKRRWGGGAWVIAFVYSNKGNFVLKGFHHEVQNRLDSMQGLKYFVNFSMWYCGQHRDWWRVCGKGVYMSEPDQSNKFKWKIYTYNNDHRRELSFKRLPKSWIPEIEALTR